MPRKNARSVVHETPSTFSRNSEPLKLEWPSSMSAANAKTSGRLLTLRSRVVRIQLPLTTAPNFLTSSRLSIRIGTNEGLDDERHDAIHIHINDSTISSCFSGEYLERRTSKNPNLAHWQRRILIAPECREDIQISPTERVCLECPFAPPTTEASQAAAAAAASAGEGGLCRSRAERQR
ncbi:hypothetical protein CB0940_08412 [Cercospora beticola]|uniref:Uncharacterized protein n=1 Tax=Cercospora beticola TaxID=122368 RepID=A0A2G5HQ10_CERBT|nr:hypothetical protein CB0940_08412 [Cercospora beticola]PIA94343.1 hypothetical protein CB0940_08412 [Cercospora beticola]WPB04988.1 hypothetical protein RHO25_009636 [Cercospora beticola]